MFKLFNQQPSKGSQITFKIDGMHCPSCALNIDSELEDVSGVITADTNYAKSKTKITYDPTKVTPIELQRVIESLDYSVRKSE